MIQTQPLHTDSTLTITTVASALGEKTNSLRIRIDGNPANCASSYDRKVSRRIRKMMLQWEPHLAGHGPNGT